MTGAGVAAVEGENSGWALDRFLELCQEDPLRVRGGVRERKGDVSDFWPQQLCGWSRCSPKWGDSWRS